MLRGQVIDRISGRGVPSARVAVASVGEAAQEPVWDGTTTADGRFVTAGLRPGTYEVEVLNAGFLPTRATVHLEEGGDIFIEIEVTPDAFELDPLLVDADAGLGAIGEPRSVDMMSRLDRDRIAALGAQRVSDLFYAIPGAMVVADPTGRAPEVILRNGCRPQLIVDGVAFSYPVGIDEVLNVHEIETLEVIHGRSAAVNASSSSCGTIRASTRRSFAPQPQASGWPKALGALVFFGGLVAVSSLF